MSKKQEKINIDELPIYFNPTLIIAGDKAKYYYDKAQKDVVMVDILSVNEAPLHGFHITWCLSHDTSKEFRTYVRKGETVEDGEWIIGTTLTKKQVKSLQIRVSKVKAPKIETYLKEKEVVKEEIKREPLDELFG